MIKSLRMLPLPAKNIKNYLQINSQLKYLGFNLSEKEKAQPIMYWIPKTHGNPVDFCFFYCI